MIRVGPSKARKSLLFIEQYKSYLEYHLFYANKKQERKQFLNLYPDVQHVLQRVLQL